jgi:hypothetical protein
MKYFRGYKSRKNYFEGWYFKHTSSILNIAFIPSISIIDKQKLCYVQVICNEFSHTFEFPYSSFIASKDKLDINISNNTFSSKEIKAELKDNEYNIKVNLKYDKFTVLKTEIMGIFAIIPFLECKHQIISMKHYVNGFITINDTTYYFNNDLGYIEKDYGSSFPSCYTWLQCNHFDHEASFFYSSAVIPFLGLHFKGLICSLIINNLEYRFATYNFAKIINKDQHGLIIKKGKYLLVIRYSDHNIKKLQAPVNGKMKRIVLESINGAIELLLFKSKDRLIHLKGINAGIEIN